jgi:maleate isomerase
MTKFDSNDIKIKLFPVMPCMGDTWKVRIGMVDLASGLTGEEEMHSILPDDVLLLTSRVLNSNHISMAALADMQQDMVRTAGTIVPEEHVDVMIYCCTSGTIAMGEDAVRNSLLTPHPEALVSNPFTAAVAAFQSMAIKNLALLTPYTLEVTDAMRKAFVKKGLNIVHTTAYDLKLDSEICQVARDDIFRSAIEQNLSGVDALFISCTGLRVVSLIEKIEAHIGIPVVTSNQAMAWHALSQANYPAPVPGFGKLMDTLPIVHAL